VLNPKKSIKISLAGQEFELSGWCRIPISIIAVAVIAAASWNHYLRDTYESLRPKVSKLEAAQEMEADRHIFDHEKTEYTEHQLDEGLEARYFHGTDKCLASMRRTSHGVDIVWSFHPDRKKQILEAPMPETIAVSSAGIGPECDGPGPGCCWDPHGGAPTYHETQNGGCVEIVTKDFYHYDDYGNYVDFCSQYAEVDHCNKEFITPWIWTRCIH
jgi:hypothetical protein